MTSFRRTRSTPARTITPPRRDRHGGLSPAWLLMQAAQLSGEIRSVLQLINGLRLNLGEELQACSQASDMLLNAAHATAIMEARLPLTPAWGNGPPRARSIFAQAREAGTDPAEVRPDVNLKRLLIDRQIIRDVEALWRDDPDPHAQCVGITLKNNRCTKVIVTGIGSQHCAVHLSPTEYQRRDKLRAAQERRMQAIQDALEEHRLHLATTWINRYGRLPHRVELPAAPSRPRQVLSYDGRLEPPSTRDEQAMLALFDSGWLTLCPRAAEIVGALLECPHATTAQLAERAAAENPKRWSSPKQWLDSNVWDGIRPPGLTLPATGEDPELDEYPPLQELRRHLQTTRREWEHWQVGFAAFVEVCGGSPASTMAELLAFWQEVGILVTDGSDKSGSSIWRLPTRLPSPWGVVHTRGSVTPPHVLAIVLDWLLNSDVLVDPDLPPREIFSLVVTPDDGSPSDVIVVNDTVVDIAS